MEVEKRGVKGGFFQLFEWNGKSRKKLFSGKSELPESSKHGKENYNGSVIARHQQGLERGFPRGPNDYHYASSAIGDSECGTKAPGVVARLMGLDSLPTSKVNEPCVTPFVEAHSFRGSSYMTSAPAFQSEHDIVIFESVRNKLDGFSRNPLDLKLQKMQSRHLERFQTEVLPPKSAKPISVTNHRLLSPIKSPGFIPPKNAAYIIEAAAKIIEQSPRSTTKGNFPSPGSSSIPFRVRDIKEKMNASQRTSRSADVSEKSKDQASVNLNKHLNGKAKSRSEDKYVYKGSEESKRVGSQRLKSKEKPVSLAVQAKANIQKREGLTSLGNRNSEKQKEHYDVRANSVSRDLTNTQKKLEKKSSSRRHSEVLKLNNQKQNRAFAEEEEDFGPSCSHQKERNESNLSTNYIHGRMNKTVNKVVVNNVVTSRKTNFVAADPEKGISSLRANTISKKKVPISGKTQSGGNVAQNTVMIQDEKSRKCNVEFEGESKWDGFDKKENGLDVVSFTFTSPIKKSGSVSSSCGTIFEVTSSSFPNFDSCVHESDFRNSASTSSGFNVMGGDALSVLLEQKLKELTSRVEMTQKDLSGAGSLSNSANSYGNMSPTLNLLQSPPVDNETCKTKREIQYISDCPSFIKHGLATENVKKGLAYIERDGDNSNIDLQGSISFSTSLSGACSDSFDVDRSSSNEGRPACLSLGSYEGMNWSAAMKSHPAEDDVEISDTASSLSAGFISETVYSGLYTMDSKESSNWELEYIGDILNSTELLLDEFALGQTHKIIAPDLFDQLESQRRDCYKVTEEKRKVLFDCVCESLQVRCGRLLAGSCMLLWVKQMTMLQNRRLLAEDLYREISSQANVEELMVDELVEKDMDSKNGKWIDFETEAFEEGIEIQEKILTSLVDELIDDFLF